LYQKNIKHVTIETEYPRDDNNIYINTNIKEIDVAEYVGGLKFVPHKNGTGAAYVYCSAWQKSKWMDAVGRD